MVGAGVIGVKGAVETLRATAPGLLTAEGRRRADLRGAGGDSSGEGRGLG